MLVAQRGDDRFRIERLEKPKGGERLDAHLRIRGAAGEAFDRRDGAFVFALVEEALGGVPLPSARAVEGGGEPGGVELGEIRWRGQNGVFRPDAVDAAFVGAGPKIEPRLRFRGNPFGMFEDGAVHIRDVERAIGPDLELRGSEPIITAREEFAVVLSFGPAAGEGRAIRREHFAMDDVIDRLADEDARLEIGPEELVAIGRSAIGARDEARRYPAG